MSDNANKSLRCAFTLHNVGQGLFYSGRIGRFNMVYDCGTQIMNSNSKKAFLKTVIDKYSSTLKKESIHLLVLSHLHEDHVSGLEYLFENNRNVDTVILPYLSPIERLLIAAMHAKSGQSFFAFISDPVVWLLNHQVQHILLLGDSEGENETPDRSPESPKIPENPFEDPLEAAKHLRDSFQDDPELEKTYEKEEAVDDGFIERHKDRLSFKKGFAQVSLFHLWEMIFYVKKVSYSKIKKFESSVLKRFKVSSGKEVLEKLLASSTNRNKLTDCYKKNIENDLNETSLCIYHGPISHSKIDADYSDMKTIENFSWTNVKHSVFRSCNSLFNSGGQLLTGDISLSSDSDLDSFESHFRRRSRDVSLLLVPHHGSFENWNSRILALFPKIRIVALSAGKTNSYGHPSPELVWDVNLCGKFLVWCDEDHIATFRQIVYY